MRKGLQEEKKLLPSSEARQLANDLKTFDWQFEGPSPGLSPVHYSHLTPIIQPLSSAVPSKPRLTFWKRVGQPDHEAETRKAPGLDGISLAFLKYCADRLHQYSQISSINQCIVPACFKSSPFISVLKKPRIQSVNDDRRVTQTSVVRKTPERLVLVYVKSIKDSVLDPLQIAYSTGLQMMPSTWDSTLFCSIWSLLEPMTRSGSLISGQHSIL